VIRAEKRIRDKLALVESQIERAKEIIVNIKDIRIQPIAKQSLNVSIEQRSELLFELEEVTDTAEPPKEGK
jgi:hypothetical protein